MPSTYRYTFRLKGGSHHDKASNVTVEVGDLFHTDDNMIRLHGRDRWELVKEGEESLDSLREQIKRLEARVSSKETYEKEPLPPAPEQPETFTEDPYADLDHKSMKELRAIAKELDVDLTDANGKTEMVNAIQAYLDTA
jgi:hypothetical protein